MGERRKRGFGVWGVHNHKITNTAQRAGGVIFVFLRIVCIIVVCTKNYEA
jgi:succinate dehydrogenase hydrophobic anchor subunit